MIFHIALASDWEAARPTGEYRISTLGRTLDQQGFIHASFDRDQVQRVGTAHYASRQDPLVVLEIDPAALTSEVRAENLEGGTELFPHIYGPLPVAAVMRVIPASAVDGTFVVAWDDHGAARQL